MGTLLYGSKIEIEIEDRALWHLQIALNRRIRNLESFFFVHGGAVNGVTKSVSIWIDRGVDLAFAYDGSRLEDFNPAWVDALVEYDTSFVGLGMAAEPDYAG